MTRATMWWHCSDTVETLLWHCSLRLATVAYLYVIRTEGLSFGKLHTNQTECTLLVSLLQFRTQQEAREYPPHHLLQLRQKLSWKVPCLAWLLPKNDVRSRVRKYTCLMHTNVVWNPVYKAPTVNHVTPGLHFDVSDPFSECLLVSSPLKQCKWQGRNTLHYRLQNCLWAVWSLGHSEPGMKWFWRGNVLYYACHAPHSVLPNLGMIWWSYEYCRDPGLLTTTWLGDGQTARDSTRHRQIIHWDLGIETESDHAGRTRHAVLYIISMNALKFKSIFGAYFLYYTVYHLHCWPIRSLYTEKQPFHLVIYMFTCLLTFCCQSSEMIDARGICSPVSAVRHHPSVVTQ